MNNTEHRPVGEQEGQSGMLKPGALGYNTPPPPRREALLASVYSQAGQQEKPMSFITRIFTGRRWYVQAGIAMALVCAIGLMWINPLKPSYAQETPGYMLKYDLGTVAKPADGSDPLAEDSRMQALEQALRAWVDSKKAAAKEAGESFESKITISVNNNDGNLTASVGMAGASAEQLDELEAVLAAVPGLPEPQIVDATWFSEGPLGTGGEGGLSLSLHDHLFSFGPGFTEKEVADTINKWLVENKPGTTARAKVIVEKSEGADGKQQMRVEVRIVDGEDSDSEGGAAEH